MPISKDGNGIIRYTEPSNKDRLVQTGVAEDDDFAVCDKDNVLKQVKIEVNPTTSSPGNTILSVDVGTGDTTINLSSISVQTFTMFQPDYGTTPTADSSNDTLILTSSDGSVIITGDATTDTIDFSAGSKRITLVSKSANYTVQTSDLSYLIMCDTSGGAFNLTLPSPATAASGFFFRIKDTKGTFRTNPVTLVRNASEKIENFAASLELRSNFGSYIVLTNGTDWFLI